MNRGLFTYLKESFKVSKVLFKRNKVNYFKFYLWIISSFIGKMLFISYPAFKLMDVKVATIANEKQKMDLLDAFEKSDNKDLFLKTLLGFFLKGVLLISGILIFLLIAGIMGGIAYVSSESVALTIALALPGVIFMFIYIIIFCLSFAPLGYVINKRDDLNLSKDFFVCAECMKKGGKKTLFGIDIIMLLLHVVYLGIAFLASYLCLSSSSETLYVIGYVLIFIFFAFYLFLAAKLVLSSRIAKIKLFDDIMNFDVSNEEKPEEEKEEVKDKKVKSKKKKIIETRSKEEILISLFNDKSLDEKEEEVVEEKEEDIELEEKPEEEKSKESK